MNRLADARSKNHNVVLYLSLSIVSIMISAGTVNTSNPFILDEAYADAQFDNPDGVAVGSAGKVYVVDKENNRVQKFTETGAFIRAWGIHGTGNGQFDEPNSIALDSPGNVYVTDFGNNRVQKFKNDGTFIAKWGSQGTGNGQFNGPTGIGIDFSTNNVYVADEGNNRIQEFTSDGHFIRTWGSLGSLPISTIVISIEDRNPFKLLFQFS